MSYCRNPFYIFPTGDGVEFSGTYIEDVQLNVWLYNMLCKNRREELMQRVKQGKQISLKMEDPNFVFKVIKENIDTTIMTEEEFDKLYYLNEDTPELQAEKIWQEANEDELIKSLLS